MRLKPTNQTRVRRCPRSSRSPDIDAGLETYHYIDQVSGEGFWLASGSGVISGWLKSLLRLSWETGSMSRPAALRFRLAGRLQKQGNSVRLFSTGWPPCTKALCRKTHTTRGNTWSPTSHCDLSTSFPTFPATNARPSIGGSRQITDHRRSFTGLRSSKYFNHRYSGGSIDVSGRIQLVLHRARLSRQCGHGLRGPSCEGIQALSSREVQAALNVAIPSARNYKFLLSSLSADKIEQSRAVPYS
jgi:hypothetical protein